MKSITGSLFLILFLIACSRPPSGMSWYQLQNGGLDIKIPTPKGVSEHFKAYPGVEDYLLQSPDGFDLQLYSFEIIDQKLNEEIQKQLMIARMEADFDTILVSSDDGFIYRRRTSENEEDFDFRLIRVLKDREVIFQSGQTVRHTRPQIDLMYEAALMAK